MVGGPPFPSPPPEPPGIHGARPPNICDQGPAIASAAPAAAAPSTPVPYTKERPFVTELLGRARLTKPGSGKNTQHLVPTAAQPPPHHTLGIPWASVSNVDPPGWCPDGRGLSFVQIREHDAYAGLQCRTHGAGIGSEACRHLEGPDGRPRGCTGIVCRRLPVRSEGRGRVCVGVGVCDTSPISTPLLCFCAPRAPDRPEGVRAAVPVRRLPRRPPRQRPPRRARASPRDGLFPRKKVNFRCVYPV